MIPLFWKKLRRLLRDLHAAIAENGSQPLIPWAQAKAELELD
jgi:hypothetical protein